MELKTWLLSNPWVFRVAAGFVVVYLVGSVVMGVVNGYFDVKERPTEPMEWCHVHGFFRKKHVLPFMNTTICPRCYKDAWQKAEKGR